MSKLTQSQIINALSKLAEYLNQPDEQLNNIISAEKNYNAWFTTGNINRAIKSIVSQLTVDSLEEWLSKYKIPTSSPKKVGLILAGNIPLVGFHDVLCVLVSGHFAMIKASSQDSHLIRHILQELIIIEPAFADQFTFTERLEGFEAVIATGSNNTSRYFDYYFGKVPNIIRKNRNSVAVLTGGESESELFALGHDVFDYFGLGCRNVSKVLVPRDYDFTFFFESIQPWHPIIDHSKYNNNYDYNKSIYLVNRDKHLDNGFLLVKEDERWVSPLAVLYYQYYNSLADVETLLNSEAEKIQCVVTGADINVQPQLVGYGMSQQPGLADYADGVDTMQFLSNLS
jgi:hypothetical protein